MEGDVSPSQTIPKEIKKHAIFHLTSSVSASLVSSRGKLLLDLRPEKSLMYNSLFNNVDDLSYPKKKKEKKSFNKLECNLAGQMHCR